MFDSTRATIVERFFEMHQKIVTDWLKDRNPQHKTAKIFNLSAETSKKEWTTACRYQNKSNRTIIFNYNGGEYFCVCSSLTTISVSKQLCKSLTEKKIWDNFDLLSSTSKIGN